MKNSKLARDFKIKIEIFKNTPYFRSIKYGKIEIQRNLKSKSYLGKNHTIITKIVPKNTAWLGKLLLTGTQGTTGFTQIASLNQNAAVQVRCLKK
ncbi:hypothetical protein [Sphingobacterium detergens]|uniref:Uncharacterized protein n=1 Tax=Sphingobacterium detergens TaxID=1145106 RepID=A0A420ALH0_SPHD1|nr:hypothetical protein [Sphingobacterium detergens]RKE45301.1 hypothetical protein DFQ12_4373 [Sphingobacterium detergens]